MEEVLSPFIKKSNSKLSIVSKKEHNYRYRPTNIGPIQQKKLPSLLYVDYSSPHTSSWKVNVMDALKHCYDGGVPRGGKKGRAHV
jgi:hypothetical protein